MDRLRPVVILAILAGIVLAIVSVMYFALDAPDLPSFIPGHEEGRGGTHPRRGAAAAVVAAVCLLYAWGAMRTGSRRR